MTTMRYSTLIHLGCGARPGLAAYRRLADQVWLVEADAEAVAALEPLVQDDTQLHLRHAVIDVSARVAPFYRYSLPWASGLVPLDEATQRLYPSLRTLTQNEVQTEAVDVLIDACLGHAANAAPGAAAQGGAGDAHLLLLDVGCHNAALLQSLEHSGALARFSTVIVVPAHRRDTQIDVPLSLYGPVDTPAGLNLPDNAQVLARHPLLHALRHAQAQLEALTAEHQQLTATRDALTEEKSALTAERDGLAKEKQALSAETQTLTTERDTLTQAKAAAEQLAAERQTQLEALTAERQQLTATRDTLTKEKSALTAERDGLAKEKQALSAEKHTLTTERDTLTQAKAAAEQRAAERQKQLETLTAERQQLTATRDTLTQARAAAEQLAAERLTQFEALTAQHQQLTTAQDALAQENAALTTERDTLKQTIAEVQQRQVLLEQELIKADAQIELIKDLLLREP